MVTGIGGSSINLHTIMSDQNLQALVNNQTFELELDNDRLRIDGDSLPYSFEPLGNNSFSLLLDGRSTSIFIEPLADGHLQVTVNGHRQTVYLKDAKDLLLEKLGLRQEKSSAEEQIRAPMPGLVLSVPVTPGDQVTPADGLIIIEAMKMENELRASTPATVTAVHVSAGETVDKNQLLLELKTQ